MAKHRGPEVVIEPAECTPVVKHEIPQNRGDGANPNNNFRVTRKPSIFSSGYLSSIRVLRGAWTDTFWIN